METGCGVDYDQPIAGGSGHLDKLKLEEAWLNGSGSA
jgi:hypothetical protein